MLSVVLLVREQPSATFLINTVQDVLPVQKVIYESWDGPPEPAPPLSKLRALKETAQMYQRYYKRRIYEEISGAKELELAARDTVFGHRWKEIETPTSIVEIYDRDWKAAQAELQSDPPDLLLVFGTGLIPASVTEIAKLGCINIHTGLSPHYRGQNCTHFPILNEDFENIGVTVHVVRKEIDGGEILIQKRPEICSGDNEFTLIKKNERLGAEIYADIIRRMAFGERFVPQGQPKDVGLLLMNRALTHGHKSLVRDLIRGGAIERYLLRQSLGKVRPKPIVERLQVRPDASALEQN